LLTGRTPVDAETLQRAGLDEIRRIIREAGSTTPVNGLANDGQPFRAPPLPDTATSSPRSSSACCGAYLDWIVMKALEKDRGRRYDTATALEEDLRRPSRLRAGDRPPAEPTLPIQPDGEAQPARVWRRCRRSCCGVGGGCRTQRVGKPCGRSTRLNALERPNNALSIRCPD